MEKKKLLTHAITEDIAIKIKNIIDGNYQQAALGTIDETGLPMVTKVIPCTPGLNTLPSGPVAAKGLYPSGYTSPVAPRVDL